MKFYFLVVLEKLAMMLAEIPVSIVHPVLVLEHCKKEKDALFLNIQSLKLVQTL